MDWMIAVAGDWLVTLKWLAGMALVFGILARLMPCNPGMYWWKSIRGTVTDLMYWFVVPLFLNIARPLMMLGVLGLLFSGRMPRPLPVAELPLWVQCIAILVIQDVILFVIHRLFHTRLAWRFHAIHHSTRMLDWSSTVRFHPVNNLLEFAVADIVVLLLGFPVTTLAALSPINTVYSALVHANLNWTFGPLRYVLASPVFHRWHHTTQEAGLNKNFASTFPVLDLICGTFYMPAGELPEKFGNGEPDFPEGFWGQMLYPFRMGRAESVSSPSGESAGPTSPPGRTRPARRKAAAVLLALAVLGGGTYYGVQLVNKNRQLAAELERSRLQQVQLAGAESITRLGLAARAWAENDLVRATAVLDEMAAAFRPASELPPQLRDLRDLCRRKCRPLTGHTGAVLGVAVSADGRRVISGGQDGTVKVWDAAAGQPELTLTGHTRAVFGVAVSGDGKHIVSGSHDHTLKVWNADTGEEERTLVGHTGTVLGVAISADGTRVVSGGTDWTVRLWDPASGQEQRTISGQSTAVLAVALSADGRRMAWATGWSVKLGTAAAGCEERMLNGHTDLVYRVALTPDGARAVSGSFDGTVKVWNAKTGRPELTLKGHDGPVYGVAISADGKRIVSGGKDRTVKVWDMAAGQEVMTLKGHTDAVTSVAVSADGKRIASGSQDGTAKVWDADACARGKN